MKMKADKIREIPKQRKIIPYITLFIMILITIFVWRWWLYAQQEKQITRFNEYENQIVFNLKEILHKYEMALMSAAGVFTASEEVSREEWKVLCNFKYILSNMSDIEYFSYCEFVKDLNLSKHVSKIRSEGFHDYNIHPITSEEFYLPVLYFEPFDKDDFQVFGYNIYSHPILKKMIDISLKKRNVTLSKKLNNKNFSTSKNVDLFMGFPVFANEINPETVAETMNNLQGFIFISFDSNKILNSLLINIPTKLDFTIYEKSEQENVIAAYELTKNNKKSYGKPFHNSSTELNIYNQNWVVEFTSNYNFEEDLDKITPYGILFIGIAVSILTYLLIRNQNTMIKRSMILANQLSKTLKQEETKLTNITNNLTDMIWTVDMNFNITYVSPAVKKILGFTRDEYMSLTAEKRYPPETMKIIKQIMNEEMENEKSAASDLNRTKIIELQEYKNDGSLIDLSLNMTFMRDDDGKAIGIQGISRDITDKKKAEKQILKSLEEKKLLINEIYHRSNNNLQVILSMLKLNLRNINDQNLKEIFNHTINKIRSMAKVQDRLYQAGDLSRIDFTAYIDDLVYHVLQSYQIHKNQIKLNLNLQSVFTTVDVAIPLGISLTELISNICKYAVKKDGEITLTLNMINLTGNKLKIELFDNGAGLKKDIDLRTDSSIGLQNVFSIIEFQLSGKIEYRNENGLKWFITVKNDLSDVRV